MELLPLVGLLLVTQFQLTIGQFTLVPGLGYYKVILEKTTWKSALHSCKEQDADLLTIDSVAEKEYVKKLLKETVGQTGAAFIGFLGDINESLWTIKGKEVPRQEVKVETLISDLHLCGKMTASGELLLTSCITALPYVCKIPLWRSYELIPNMGYYKLFEEGRTWSEARKRCEQDGAHLAVVDTRDKLEALRRILARYHILPLVQNSKYIATGVRKVVQYDKFVTVHGDDYNPQGITFNSQFATHPNHCLFIPRHAAQSTTSLQVESCQIKYAFICEMKVKIHEFK